MSTTPSNLSSVSWTVAFSESVTGVDASDFALAQSSIVNPHITNVSGAGSTYTVTASTGTSDGTLGLNLVDNDTIVDLANNGLAGNFTGQVYAIDTILPTVTINKAAAQADPTKTSPVNFTVVFSEAVTAFATGDVALSGTAGATTATVSGSGTTYNVAVSGMTANGTVVASVAANKALDKAANGNVASTSTDNSVT